LYEDGDNQTGQANLALINSSLIWSIVSLRIKAFLSSLYRNWFYQEPHNDILDTTRDIWNQELVSENGMSIGPSYLAYSIF
jgi:hypothetical protein